LTQPEVDGLTGVASCEAYIQVNLRPVVEPAPEGLEWPADDALQMQLASAVEPVISGPKVLNAALVLVKANVHPNAATRQQEGHLEMDRQVHFRFQVSLANGAKEAINNIKSVGVNLPAMIASAATAAALPYMQYVTTTDYMSLVYTDTQTGEVLHQRTGQKKGNVASDNGTGAFKVSAAPAPVLQ